MRQHIHETAPAKLNLILSVGPLDGGHGRHPISSWMVTIDLSDDLHVTRLADDSISRYAIRWHDDARRRSDIDWRIEDDLSVAAHRALERFTNRRLPVQMRLEKRIPLGGGLGGGSSDAAAMLRACNRLFALELADEDLRHVAASIGSDVPFLVSGGSAIVGGFGDRIEALDAMPDFCAVLFFPEATCSTAAVYGRFDARGGGLLRADTVRESIASGRFFNDLTEPALEEAPAIQAQLIAIEHTAGRPVHVSGSGSTLFLTCDTSMEAGAIAAAIESTHHLPAIPARPMRIDARQLESID
jgi:4-diphosphocytidyl-2-C-methyl-D-erythritol kinase